MNLLQVTNNFAYGVWLVMLFGHQLILSASKRRNLLQ
jgi:hypothetical protein